MKQSMNGLPLFISTSLLSSAFTAATTDIITVTGHGYAVGDKVRVSSSTTLPGGLSANTDYYVIEVISANTIKVSATPGGTAVDITSTGTGTHTMVLKSKVIFTKGFGNLNLSLQTANNANFTVKVQISDQEDVDFESASTPTNDWSYVQNINNEDGSAIDGNTGITQDVPGTDENKRYSLNIDGSVWVCLDVTTWTAGTLTATASLLEN